MGKLQATLRALVLSFAAAQAAAIADQTPTTLDVWPGTPPGINNAKGLEQDVPGPSGMLLPKQAMNVSRPTLTVFAAIPATPGPGVGSPARPALIVLPGGGFRELEMEKEGEEAARWATTLGITAFVLKYRVPTSEALPNYYVPGLQDAQRSVSLVRANASAWRIDPRRIGVIGFSAGANLSARACTAFSRRAYAPVDSADEASCRPDFGIIVYPGSLVPKGTSHLVPEITVTRETPQMFIVDAEMDRVNSDNSVLLFLALKRAGIPAEIHIYAAGVHGFALRASRNPHAMWPLSCAAWLYGQGILQRP